MKVFHFRFWFDLNVFDLSKEYFLSWPLEGDSGAFIDLQPQNLLPSKSTKFKIIVFECGLEAKNYTF